MRIKTTEKGERVIMDPAVTVSRVYLYFYLMINIGSLVGSIGMVYAEKYVGFWLSFLLPTLMLCKYSSFPSQMNYTKTSRSVSDGYLCLQRALYLDASHWLHTR